MDLNICFESCLSLLFNAIKNPDVETTTKLNRDVNTKRAKPSLIKHHIGKIITRDTNKTRIIGITTFLK